MVRPSRRMLVLVGLGALTFGLWDHPAIWPLKVLIVLVHELGHAIAAMLTGGTVTGITLDPDQGGGTTTRGGLRFFILSAGYLSSLAFGVLGLWASQGPRRTRAAGVGVGALLIVTAAVWMRPFEGFAFQFTVLAGVITLLVAVLAPAVVGQGCLRGLGVFSVLYGLWDIRDDVFARSIGTSDASQLAALTFIPAPIWGVLWIGIGIGTLVALRRWWL